MSLRRDQRPGIQVFVPLNGVVAEVLGYEDSLCESSGLDGLDEQAASPRLPYHELALVQPRARAWWVDADPDRP